MRLRSLAALISLFSATLAQANEFQVLIHDGDPVPNGTLEVTQSSVPMLSGPRVVTFIGKINGRDTLMALRGQAFDVAQAILQDQQSTPSGDGRIQFVSRWSIAADGSAHVSARLTQITQYGNRAIYRVTPGGQITEQVRSEKPMGPGMPALCSGESAYVDHNVVWRRNGTGLTPFGTSQGGCQRPAIWQMTPGGAFTQAVSLGRPVLGTSDTLDLLTSSTTEATTLGNLDDSLLFVGRDTGSNNRWWYANEGNGVRRIVDANSGDPYASRHNTLTFNNRSTHRISQHVNGDPTPHVLLQRGQVVPGGDGQFYSFREVSVSDDGRVLVLANLTGTPGGTSDDQGYYLADHRGVVEIARENRAASIPGITFTSFVNAPTTFSIAPTVNGHGRVLFSAVYTVGGISRTGLFHFHRMTGLEEVFTHNITPVAGTTTNTLRIRHPIAQSAEVAATMSLQLGTRTPSIALIRFDSLFADSFD